MSKIIVLSDDVILEKYLEPLEKQIRFNIQIESYNFDSVDKFRSLLSDEENILILDSNDFSKTKDFIDTIRMQCNAFLILAFNEVTPEIEKYCEAEAMLMGVIDTTKPVQMHTPLFNILLRRITGVGKQDLAEISENLTEVVEYTLSELQRVKTIHERLVPVRADDLKGLKISSKFAAGESSGGEFYDIIKNENECLVLLSNSKSYVISSLILSNFEIFREQNSFSNELIKQFIENINNEIISRELPEKRKEVDLFIARVDLKKMTLDGYSVGKSELVTSEGQFITTNNFNLDNETLEESKISLRMSRGEKLMLLSPGIKSNCDGLLGGMSHLSFAKDQVKSESRQALDEMFFQLKRFTNTSFLKDDASIIIFEVKPNVIVQV
jgi:hypothetical protein